MFKSTFDLYPGIHPGCKPKHEPGKTANQMSKSDDTHVLFQASFLWPTPETNILYVNIFNTLNSANEMPFKIPFLTLWTQQNEFS